MSEMRVFVCQYVSKLFFVKMSFPVDIDRGGKESGQAGRAKSVYLKNRKLVYISSRQNPIMPQPASKTDGTPQKDPAAQKNACDPQCSEDH